ncbi:unnamed protein product, partial [Oikopleura dioica]
MGNVLSGRQRNASSSTIGGKKRGESTSSRNQERRSPKMPYRLVLQIFTAENPETFCGAYLGINKTDFLLIRFYFCIS